ncbi:hypothetical protein QBC41DRAFT_239960 [Cercophora samala]|uniref:Fungal STAND N-terminal Goodbye domain-containing protein n=1 Tax=Cercophora samala TaxID=330535 RepID=A0AA39ZNV5_9PEZI|nr:hypothetical protein QBC41DRAFT_239960 [Cercophora samala]
MEKPVPVVKVEAVQPKSKVDEMWQEALVTFKSLTGKNLQDVAPASPEELRKIIEARAKEQDSEDYKNRSKARERGLRILACINKFGEAAVQGVSTVFGGADICFKGLSLLLELPKKMKEFHEVVDKIFIRIAPVLLGFKVYAKGEQIQAMDDDLIISIHKVMIALVTICATALNIEHARKWERFKNFTKRALCDDTELDEELEKFQMLVEGQQHVQGAVTLVEVLDVKATVVANLKATNENLKVTNEINSDTKGIKSMLQRKEAESAKTTQVNKIKAALGFANATGKDGDKDGDTDNSKTALDDYLKKRIDGTGSWFKGVEAYTSWAKMDTSASGGSSLLFLTGPSGSGKSFSVASMVNDLKEQSSTSAVTAQTHRYLTTFYFFPSRSETNPVEVALKWIAVQLAEADEAYRKSMDDIEYLNPLRYARPLKLWNALKLGAPMSRTTHFIVFDGLDNLPAESLQQLLEIIGNIANTTPAPTNQHSVRILASGQPEIFDTIRKTESLLWREIKVDGTIMEPEFRPFIRQKLNAPGMLPGRDLKSKRDDVENKIIQSDSNFKTIQGALTVVEACITSGKTDEELYKALEETTKDADILMRQRVEKLEAELDMRQIGWVNELLIWILFAERPFDLADLEAAFLARGKTVPIQGLENFITTRLKRLITMGPNRRPQVEDGVAKVVTKPREVSQTGSESKTISLSIEIKNADVSTVQRFLWDLTKFGALDNFAFQPDDTGAQTVQSRGTIRVNQTDASLAIVNSFFKFLEEESYGDSRMIATSLVEDLPKHLRKLRTTEGEDAINDDERGAIGKRLYGLLEYPDEVFKNQWNILQVTSHFLCRNNLEEYWEWIRHDATANALQGKPKADLNKLRNDPDWTAKLLKPVKEFVANLWLRNRGEDVYWIVNWVIEFVSQEKVDQSKTATPVAESSESQVPATPATPPPPPPPQVGIAEAAKWCMELLGLKDNDLDSLWFERLADTYSQRDERAEAISAYRKALELYKGDPTWELLTGLCRNLYETGPTNLEEARSLHDRAMTLYKDSEVSLYEKVAHLRTIARSKAFRGAPGKALEFFKEAHELAPDDGDVAFDLIRQLNAVGQEVEAQVIFAKIAESKKVAEPSATEATDEAVDEDAEVPSRLSGVIEAAASHEFWKRTDLAFWRLVSMATATNHMDTFMRDLEASYQQAVTLETNWTQSMLLMYKGIAHFASHHTGFGNLETAVASCEQARQFARDTTDTYKWWVEQIFEKATTLFDRYHFNQASGKGRLADTTVQDVGLHIRALESSASAFEKYCTGLGGAKAYLAAYYTLQKDFEAARGVFSSDMVRISNMLSDGDSSNDSDGLIQLKAILLFTGDIANAVVGFRLLPPHLGKIGVKHFKALMAELFCPEGKPAEGSIAAEILTWADEEYSKTEEPLAKFEEKVDKILEKHATRKAVVTDVTDGGDAALLAKDNSAEKQDKVVIVSSSSEAGDGDATAIKALQALRRKLNFNLERTCDSCWWDDITDRAWDFDRETYACKYCWVDLCEPCLDKIKKADKGRFHPVCSPDHEWIRLPKWTVGHWMDTFRNVVRVPRIIGGEIVDDNGGEVVPVAEWFKGVFGRWGIEHDKDWDINDKEPEEEEKKKEEEGEKKEGEKGEGEKKDDEAEPNGERTDGEKVNGEGTNGTKVTVELVAVEKATVEKVTVTEVTGENGSQAVVST